MKFSRRCLGVFGWGSEKKIGYSTPTSYQLTSVTFKGLKCVTLICLLCPMLVIIHFQKYHYLEREEEMTDQSNFVNNVT